MRRHTVQTSSKSEPHSDELQLAVHTQQNKHQILQFQIKKYQNQDELNLLLNTAKQLEYHYFAVEQQTLPSLPDKGSQVSQIAFLSYLIKIHRAQLTKGSIFSICDTLTNTYISFIYCNLFNPLSDTLFELLNGICTEIQPSDRTDVYKKLSFEFLKHLASTLNTAALQSRKESVQKN